MLFELRIRVFVDRLDFLRRCTNCPPPLTFHSQRLRKSTAAISPDGRLMAVSSDRGLVRIWDLGTAQLAAEVRGHTAPVNSLMFSQDGRRLLTASDDRTARIWDASNGASL